MEKASQDTDAATANAVSQPEPEVQVTSDCQDVPQEVESEEKDEDKEVDANVIERLSDAFSDIEDAADLPGGTSDGVG